MAATNTKLRNKTFEHKWVIKNWKNVVQNEALVKNTTAEFKLEENGVVFAEVLVGTSYDQVHKVGFFWKILSKHPNLDNIRATLVAEILRTNASAHMLQNQANGAIRTTMVLVQSFWIGPYGDNVYAAWTNAEGSMEINLKFTLKDLPEVTHLSKMEDFRKTCKDELSQNISALLDDKLDTDIKILTKDKTEFLAHKTILRARCPVFVSMFGSNVLGGRSGVVNLNDISAKTLKILLNYWYTGDLLPSWKDDDTIVEFIYAAGKYQITHVLKMLDDVIGYAFKPSEVDVELLRMTQQLSLKNAESETLKRLISKISQVAEGTELLGLFYQTNDNLGEESFTGSQILKVFNDVMCENVENDASYEDVKILALACKLDMKNVEKKILKRIVDTVTRMSTADELFALFEYKLQESGLDSVPEKSEARDLLVRVNL